MLIFILLSILSIYKMKSIEGPEVNKVNMGRLAYFKVGLSHYSSAGECLEKVAQCQLGDGQTQSRSESW